MTLSGYDIDSKKYFSSGILTLYDHKNIKDSAKQIVWHVWTYFSFSTIYKFRIEHISKFATQILASF